MHRFYADESRSSASVAYLTPEDAHHALNVLRLRSGDQVEVFLAGARYLSSIRCSAPGEVSLNLERLLPSTEPQIRIVLFQGLPKGDKMDWIIQKSVELGISGIVPVEMSRSVLRLSGDSGARKAERWQRIAREAGKQSGRCLIPAVSAPVALNHIAPQLSGLDAVIVPWECSEAYGPAAFARDFPSPQSLGIFIGPEGGISEEEIDFLKRLSVLPITLGPRILRTETAGIATISALLALYGEMG